MPYYQSTLLADTEEELEEAILSYFQSHSSSKVLRKGRRGDGQFFAIMKSHVYDHLERSNPWS